MKRLTVGNSSISPADRQGPRRPLLLVDSGRVQHLRVYGLAPDRWAAAVDNFDKGFGRRLDDALDLVFENWRSGQAA